MNQITAQSPARQDGVNRVLRGASDAIRRYGFSDDRYGATGQGFSALGAINFSATGNPKVTDASAKAAKLRLFRYLVSKDSFDRFCYGLWPGVFITNWSAASYRTRSEVISALDGAACGLSIK